MTLAEITFSRPRRIRQGRLLYLAWSNFWVSIDNGKPGQWAGYWSQPEVEAVVALAGLDDGPQPIVRQ